MLDIRLFGTACVRRVDLGGEHATLAPAEVDLLAYIALQRGRPVSRDAIIADLWRDGSDVPCRRRLNTTLWRLRNAVEYDLPAGTFIRSDRSSVMLDTATVDLDVSRFETATEPVAGLAPSMDSAAVAALEAGVNDYRGDLMEGRYTDWVIEARERLVRRYLGALARLLGWYFDRGDYEPAIATGTRLLERDPLREDVHRTLIRSFSRIGDRSRAIEQYRVCRAFLADELGVEPLPETTAAVAGWPSAAAPDRRQASTGGLPAEVVLEQLQDLRARVSGLAEAIDAAIEQLAPSS